MSSKNPTVAAILDRSGDANAVAWAHEGVGTLQLCGDPEAAVAAAVALRNVAALQAASGLGAKALRKLASAGLHRLRAAGVIVPEAAPRSFQLAKEELETVIRAFVGVPDPEGDMEILLIVATDLGTGVAGLVLGGFSGVRDRKLVSMDRAGVRDVLRTVDRHGRAEVPFASALALALPHLGAEPGWGRFVALLPPGLLQSAQILDPLARRLPDQPAEPAGLSAWAPHPDLLEEAPLHAAIGPLIGILESPLFPDDASKRDAMDLGMRAAADQCLTERSRAAMVQYLEHCRSVLWLAGWDRTHARRGVELEEVASGRPGSEIPGVQATVRMYLTAGIRQVLERGE